MIYAEYFQKGLSFKHGLWLGSLLTLCLLAALTIKSQADWYGVASFGQGRWFNSGGHDRAWEQSKDGYASVFDPVSPVWSLGVGNRFSRHFAWEMAFHDLGKYTQFGLWSYGDADPIRTCPPHCIPTDYGYSLSRTKGESVSGLFYWPLSDADPYIRLGALHWHSTWHTYIGGGSLYNKSFYDYHAQTEYGWSPMLGIGVKLGSWAFEATRFSQIKPHDGAIQGIDTFTAAWRF